MEGTGQELQVVLLSFIWIVVEQWRLVPHSPVCCGKHSFVFERTRDDSFRSMPITGTAALGFETGSEDEKEAARLSFRYNVADPLHSLLGVKSRVKLDDTNHGHNVIYYN